MKIINYLLVLTIFLDAFILIEYPVNVYAYYLIYIVFIILYIVWYKQIKIPATFFIAFLSLTFISLVVTSINGIGGGLVVKQFILISFVSMVFYLLIRINNYDIIRIFKYYIDIAFFISILGLLQEVLFVFGFSGQYEYKVTSIVSEPAHLAIALTPAFYMAVGYFLINRRDFYFSKRKLYTIVACYFLTFSGVAFIGVVICLAIFLLEKFVFNLQSGFFKRFVLSLSFFAVIFIFVVSAYHIPALKMRIDDTLKVITTDESIPADKINLSTFALYSNFMVTTESLKRNLFFGSGIGTHGINYDKYIGNFFPDDYLWRKMELNREDANSLMLRLLSETGIVGTVIFLIFLFKNIIPYKDSYLKNPENFHFWLINNGILASIILRLIRFGNYTVLGFPFFLFLFFLSYRWYNINKKKKIEISNCTNC